MTGNKQRIIITGGLGYLGQRIAKDLAAIESNDVFVTSRSNRKVSESLQHCSFLKLDLEDSFGVQDVIKEDDVVIHLAAPNEIDAGRDVKLALNGTVVTTYNLLEACRIKKARQLIYFSTFHVYGLNGKGRITEDTLPRPTHPYSISHKAAEDFCLAHREMHHMNVVVFRLSNAIGAPVSENITRWTLAANDMCLQAVLRQEITLKTYGQQLRDFISIGSVCEAIKHVINQYDADPYGLYNLGSGHAISIYDLACIIQKEYEDLTGEQISIVRSEQGKDQEPAPFDYSIKRLTSTGFVSSSDVNQAIRETIRFCLNHKTTLNNL